MAAYKGVVATADYTFDKTAKTITFSANYTGIALSDIMYITNVKSATATVIYDPSNAALGGSLSGLVLTLAYDTTAMLSADPLQIIVAMGTLAAKVDSIKLEVSGSAASLNGTPIASTDVSSFKWVSVHIPSGSFNATVEFQVSNDGSSWENAPFHAAQANTVAIISFTQFQCPNMFVSRVQTKYFRVIITSWTSGTVTAYALFSSQSSSPPANYATITNSTLSLAAETTKIIGTVNLSSGQTLATVTSITNVVHVDDNSSSLTVDAPVGTPLFARLSDGSAALIGQKAMSASLPVVIASDQDAITTKAALFEQTGSASSGSTDLVTLNVSSYKWVSVQLTGFGTASIAFQGSNDNTNWFAVSLTDANAGTPTTSVTSSGIYYAPINSKFFRVRATSVSSGTISAIAEFSNLPSFNLISGSSQVGTWTTKIKDVGDVGITSASNAINSTGSGILNSATIAQFDDVSPTAITENNFGSVRMSANRNLYSTIRDAAGNERGANITAANELLVSVNNSSLAVTATLAAETTKVIGTINVAASQTIAVTNTGTFAVQATPVTQADTFMLGGVNVKEINAVTPLMGSGIMGTGSLRVTIASDNDAITIKQGTAANLNATVVGTGTFVVQATLAAETTKVIGTVNVASSQTIAVTQATAASLNMTEANAANILTKLTAGAASMIKLEDVASADGDAGSPAMAIQKATPADTAGTDGDYAMLQMSAGRLWVAAKATLDAETTKVIGTINIASSQTVAVTNAGTFVTQSTLAAETTKVIGTVNVAGSQTIAVTNTGTFATQVAPSTSGGLTTFHLISAATTNLTVVKAGVGQLYGWYVYNNAATVRKIAFHNTTSTPSAGASIFFSIVFPPNSGANVEFSNGISFSTGIAISTVTGIADTDTVAVALNDLTINLFYK